MTRRELLYLIGGAAVGAGTLGTALSLRSSGRPARQSLLVNDVHSKLNEATVRRIETPTTLEEVLGQFRRAKREKLPICIAGSRHAMGGQQFANDAVLIDTRGLNTVMDFDSTQGLVQVEAGIEWPDLVRELDERQPKVVDRWTIRCKQTGADKLTLGGAIAANAHGRTLSHPPMIADIEEIILVDAGGDVSECSRTHGNQPFSLAHGGYGLFGLVHSAVYRLERRHKLVRAVEIVDREDLEQKFQQRIDQGYTLGDWQYAIDDRTDDFLSTGVFSCYKPVPIDTPIPESQETVSDRAWQELVYLAHTDKAKAFKLYTDFYMGTSGQVYWSDTSQLGGYDEDYHVDTDRRMKAKVPATEMITEINVPRGELSEFLKDAADTLRRTKADVIYGTVRLIDEDTESFLPWARGSLACVIFNLHVPHSEQGMKNAIESFRALIDLAAARRGTYYLTYHRWATKEQVEACYPKFSEFLAMKEAMDPDGVFQSEWYRHYRKLFAA